MLGAYGTRGSIKLLLLSPDVDKILSESQKDIVRNFSCCLVPPKGLSDPVRAGQAAGGEKEIELLRFVRNVSPEQWPAFRRIAMEKLDQLVAGKSPGATDADKSEARKRVGAVYDRTRSLSETEFEMEKAKECPQRRNAADSASSRLTESGVQSPHSKAIRCQILAYFGQIPIPVLWYAGREQCCSSREGDRS